MLSSKVQSLELSMYYIAFYLFVIPSSLSFFDKIFIKNDGYSLLSN